MNELFISMLPIETERLFLRKISLEDLELFLKMDKQEETQKYLGGIKNRTREERIELINKKIEKFKNGQASMLTVCLKDGTSIGFTGLKIDEEKREAVLSYLFDADYTNNGYCTEACKKLIEVGFQDLMLERVVADSVETNIKSQRVLFKLGFDFKESFKKEDDTAFNYYELSRKN